MLTKPRTSQTSAGQASERAGIPILSFFTGAGFLDLGFAQSGFEAIWHNEFEEAFSIGFEYAMRSSPSDLPGSKKVESLDSILNIGPNEIAKSALGDRTARGGFGMIGGPPCPDFSVGGKNRGSEGENGQLTQTYVERIRELEPDFFVLENVPGLVRTRKHREFFDEVIGSLEKKYLYSWELLNALDFGVPQDRQRVVVVGFKRTVLRKLYGTNFSRRPSAGWSLNIASTAIHKSALTRYQWPDTKIGAAWIAPVDHPIELTVSDAFARKDGALPSELPNGTDYFRPISDKFSWIIEGDDSKKSFKRLHRLRYSPAAAYGNNEVHVHPVEPRRITVREAMRIQTVPDWYKLPPEMTLTKKFKTVGNGVPVRLATCVANQILEVLDGVRAISG